MTLHEEAVAAPQKTTNVLSPHDALEALAQEDDGKARIIEMRYFRGIEIRVARAWLLRRMKGEGGVA